VETDYLISEIRVETHARTIARQCLAELKAAMETYAKATGRFVRKPNMKDARPEIAAVAVMRSRCISSVF
jgi:hypothetical protein